MLLSHADRSRFASGAEGKTVTMAPSPMRGWVLHDGSGCGAWWIDTDRDMKRATLVINHVAPLTAETEAVLEAEALALLRFTEAQASGFDVRFRPVG